MIDTLKRWDTDLFLFFNGQHNEFWDVVMFWMTKGWFWIPVYFLFLYYVVKHYRKQTFYIIIAYAVLITLTDQVSVQLFKNLFHRFRPSHEPSLQGLVHTVNGYLGGNYGFVSSHASNFFGITTFTVLLLKGKVKYLQVFLFIWAIFICYTRIYLGVHYPGDIAVGALVGILIGYGIYRLTDLVLRKLAAGKETNLTQE
jgi:undecaprenyl-diphosphatase